MGHQADLSKASSSEVISRTAALLVACMGGFVLASWGLHVQVFEGFLPVFRKMSTVLGIVYTEILRLGISAQCVVYSHRPT